MFMNRNRAHTSPINATEEITVVRLAPGGDGVGHIDGKVCFVPYSVPGDHLRIQLTQTGRRFSRGSILEILSPGPGRRAPLCPLFETCGGCNWLHIDESVQRAAKAEFLSHALEVPVPEVVPSPLSLGYRGPARLHFHADSSSVVLGFMAAAGTDIVDVSTCPILSPRLNDCLLPLREALRAAATEDALHGEIRLATGQDTAGVCFRPVTPPSADFYRAVERLPRKPFSGATLSVDGLETPLFGAGTVTVDGVDGRPFVAPASSFGQANTGINRRIAEAVRRSLEARSFRRGIELFAGAGNLSVTIAPFVKKLVVSELDEAACLQARINLESRGYTHARTVPGEAKVVFEREGTGADLVVLNPPRTGHLELVGAVAEAGPEAVLYVSCNPSTLARDVAKLRQAGYNLAEISGFDMFPQTAHMEATVLLER